MKNPIDQFIENARKVRLTGEASARLRSRLIAHMRAHPVSSQPLLSPYRRFFNTLSPFSFSLRAPAAALALVLLVTLGGATTFAASGALPGEPLYRLKVNVIEPIKGFVVARSPEEKAKWQVSLAEERVREVEQLATKERMTTEEGMRSRERFDDSVKEARSTIKKLSQDNPDAATEIEASFSASIITHEDDLHKLSDKASSTNAREARVFADHIRASVLEDKAKEESPTTREKIENAVQKINFGI